MFNIQSVHIALLLWGFIFCLIAAFCTSFSYNYDQKKKTAMVHMQLSSALLLFSDAFAWFSRGGQGIYYYYIVRISNFMVFFMSDVVLMLFHYFLCLSLFKDQKKPKIARVTYIIALISLVLVIVSQFTDLYYYIDARNYYHRNTYYFLSVIFPLIGILIDLELLIKYNTNLSQQMFLSMMSYIVLPIISSILLIFYYGISLTNIAISISMIFMFVSAMIEQSNKLIEKEKEAADLKISLTLSQVTPHFIFNALTTIQYLCGKDPQLAKETIGEFAGYLRGNINSLNQNEKISFDKELEHVNYYLAIEKKRFGERIQVEYDIQESNFFIPSLTLQPLVENAVKYGLCKKEGGGTILIQTHKMNQEVVIKIKDDGIGFDPHILEDRKHTGINNVKKRIESLCKGKLNLKTEINKGTEITLTIPL